MVHETVLCALVCKWCQVRHVTFLCSAYSQVVLGVPVDCAPHASLLARRASRPCSACLFTSLKLFGMYSGLSSSPNK